MTINEFLEWYYDLPLLTYGELNDADVLSAFYEILTWKHDKVFISEDIPDDLFTTTEYWLYLGLLGDCIEYGTSPRSAWLTEFGEGVLHILSTTPDLADKIEEGIPIDY